jgi:hypothetical protein
MWHEWVAMLRTILLGVSVLLLPLQQTTSVWLASAKSAASHDMSGALLEIATACCRAMHHSSDGDALMSSIQS